MAYDTLATQIKKPPKQKNIPKPTSFTGPLGAAQSAVGARQRKLLTSIGDGYGPNNPAPLAPDPEQDHLNRQIAAAQQRYQAAQDRIQSANESVFRDPKPPTLSGYMGASGASYGTSMGRAASGDHRKLYSDQPWSNVGAPGSPAPQQPRVLPEAGSTMGKYAASGATMGRGGSIKSAAKRQFGDYLQYGDQGPRGKIGLGQKHKDAIDAVREELEGASPAERNKRLAELIDERQPGEAGKQAIRDYREHPRRIMREIAKGARRQKRLGIREQVGAARRMRLQGMDPQQAAILSNPELMDRMQQMRGGGGALDARGMYDMARANQIQAQTEMMNSERFRLGQEIARMQEAGITVDPKIMQRYQDLVLNGGAPGGMASEMMPGAGGGEGAPPSPVLPGLIAGAGVAAQGIKGLLGKFLAGGLREGLSAPREPTPPTARDPRNGPGGLMGAFGGYLGDAFSEGLYGQKTPQELEEPEVVTRPEMLTRPGPPPTLEDRRPGTRPLPRDGQPAELIPRGGSNLPMVQAALGNALGAPASSTASGLAGSLARGMGGIQNFAGDVAGSAARGMGGLWNAISSPVSSQYQESPSGVTPVGVPRPGIGEGIGAIRQTMGEAVSQMMPGGTPARPLAPSTAQTDVQQNAAVRGPALQAMAQQQYGQIEQQRATVADLQARVSDPGILRRNPGLAERLRTEQQALQEQVQQLQRIQQEMSQMQQNLQGF